MAHTKHNRSLIWGLLGIALFTAIGCGSFLGTGYGPKVENGTVEVYYTEGATADEATKLAALLNKMLTPDSKTRSAQVKKSGDAYQLRIVTQPGTENDERNKAALQIIGVRASQEVLNGAIVEVHICDQKLKTLSVLPFREDLKFVLVQGKVEVFYPNENLKTDAQNLATYLGDLFKDSPTPKAAFKLAKRDKVNEVHIVMNAGQWDDPKVVAGLAVDAKDISRKVFGGAPVEMHICDDVFNVKKVVK